MSLLLRLKHQLPKGLYEKLNLVTLNAALSRNVQLRNLGQAAAVGEEVEIDPRRLPADYDPASFDPTEHRSPPTERVWRLVDEISGLTLAEIAELGPIIMKKRGMTEAPSVGVMKAGAVRFVGMAAKASGGGAKEEKVAEKTVFELKLESFEAASKIKIIKERFLDSEIGKEFEEIVEISCFLCRNIYTMVGFKFGWV